MGGIFCHELSINFSYRRSDYCNFFEAEVAVIKVELGLQLRSAASLIEVTIYSDSKATILALSLLTVASRLVKECLSTLSMASSYQ